MRRKLEYKNHLWEAVGLIDKAFMVIENVILKSACQGRGIGKILMREIKDIGRKRDCFYMMFVAGGHRKAHKFYEAIEYDLDHVKGVESSFKQ